MMLAAFLREWRSELVCDMYETYNAYLYGLPPTLAAVLAAGLPDCSRVKMADRGFRITLETSLLARIADGVSIIAWMLSEDGVKRINRPASILAALQDAPRRRNPVIGFATAADFMAARQRILEGRSWK